MMAATKTIGSFAARAGMALAVKTAVAASSVDLTNFGFITLSC
jgi:hypothetical protein